MKSLAQESQTTDGNIRPTSPLKSAINDSKNIILIQSKEVELNIPLTSSIHEHVVSNQQPIVLKTEKKSSRKGSFCGRHSKDKNKRTCQIF